MEIHYRGDSVMKTWQSLSRRMLAILLSAAMLALAAANTAQAADDFWAHQIGVQVNVAYGEDPAQVFDPVSYTHLTLPTISWV